MLKCSFVGVMFRFYRVSCSYLVYYFWETFMPQLNYSWARTPRAPEVSMLWGWSSLEA